jgi:LysM repeat protein
MEPETPNLASDERLVQAVTRSLRMLLASGEFQWNDSLDPESPEGLERLRRLAEMALSLVDIPDDDDSGPPAETEQKSSEPAETAATRTGGAITSRLNTAEVQQLQKMAGQEDSSWRFVPRWILVFALVAATTFAVARFCNVRLPDSTVSAVSVQPSVIAGSISQALANPTSTPTTAPPPVPPTTAVALPSPEVVEVIAVVETPASEEPAPLPEVQPESDEPTPVPAPQVVRYVVQPGDNLSTIARRYRVNQATLQAQNGLANPNALRVGQVLVIN